ncbi:hypothetical protein [Sphingopyxis flava]|uniref:Uncharacterized protein n=1 Tax=Sphingopyxis flava TaxID=1507287 RepID=A0A1T4ZWA3_9SPHN|nr:hypothetical protein [Sphingopyxis flava]SKB26905.1 hypothetical protein SAMN06295937_1001251 [Sphingopyxis flava]
MSDDLWIASVIAIVVILIAWIVLANPDGKPPSVTSDAPAAQQLPQVPVALKTDPGGGWSLAGWMLTICSVAALAVSISMKTTVSTYGAAILGSTGPSEIANLDMMFQKGMAIAGSLAGLGLGVFCIAVGAILRAITPKE